MKFTLLMLTVVLLLVGSLTAIAAEKYVVSVSTGNNVILKTLKLDQNGITTLRSQIIESNYPIQDTAVLSRKLENGDVVLDVYYVACTDDFFFCDYVTLYLTRVDLHLNIQFTKPLSVPAYNFATSTIESKAGPAPRLLVMSFEKLLEHNLDAEGNPSENSSKRHKIGFWNSGFVSEDGKVFVSSHENNEIEILSLRPKGRSTVIQTEDHPRGVAVSGPIAAFTKAAAVEKSYRYVFFRGFLNESPFNIRSRIMRMKIDDATGELIGKPKPITKFNPGPDFFYLQSVSVSPDANLVLYTEFDSTCRTDVVVAQQFDPIKGKQVGPPQVAIGCSDIPFRGTDPSGIDIVPVLTK